MYMAFEIFSVGSMDGVAHFAHLGGALVGFLYLMADGYQFGSSFRAPKSEENVFTRMTGFGKSQKPDEQFYTNVSDAKVYDLSEHMKKEEQKAQVQIDEILDKISKNGYQSLSSEEKKILFEASKKLN
jgi:hypothetical protein